MKSQAIVQTVIVVDTNHASRHGVVIEFYLYRTPEQKKAELYRIPNDSDFVFRTYGMTTIGEIDFYEVTEEEIESIQIASLGLTKESA